MNDLVTSYTKLQKLFECQAKKEGTIYLPSIQPMVPVDFVFVAMEPSLKRWARDYKDAKDKIKLGFKDFTYSLEDFILHYCAMNYLCSAGLTYYVTNLSKGAMDVNKADQKRQERYKLWFPLFKRELQIVAKQGAKIIAIGKEVANFLRKEGFDATPVLHFSGRAAKYRVKLIQGREKEFEHLKVSMVEIEDIARVVLRNAETDKSLAEGTLQRISRSNLSRSRKMLIFGYKVTFENLRSDYK